MQEQLLQFGRVEELLIDEEFEAHMAEAERQYEKHNVSAIEVLQVQTRAPEYFDNVGEGRRASIIMLGPTNNDRMLAVPLEPTHDRGVWHPVTAFEANTHDRQRYEERRQH